MAKGNNGRRRDRSDRIRRNGTDRRRRPALDRLEERALLAVTSAFADGVLTVTSDAGDAIAITEAGGNVQVNGADAVPTGLPASDVTSIVVSGGPDANAINLSGVSSTTFGNLLTTSIDGAGGDDSIIGSALGDQIFGGPGADDLFGGPGADEIFGLAGDDLLRGGTGDDTLVGGQGADSVLGGVADDDAETLVGLDPSAPALLSFSADEPGTVIDTTPISGLVGGGTETIVGIDTRPDTGDLVALTGEAGTGRLYTIAPDTGAATLLSTLAADPGDATDPYAGLVGADFGIDFNPVVDRLRVVSDADQNLRIDVDSGAVITDAPLAFDPADENSAEDPAVSGAAYTNPTADASETILYAIDPALDALLIQAPPNDGTLNTLGELGVDASSVLGFDILPGSGRALASLVVGGSAGLYEIDLETGAATEVGDIDDGTTDVGGLTLLSDGSPLEGDDDVFIWNNGDGSDLVEGGLGTDSQIVNGRTTSDAFEIGAGPGGRLEFQRQAPGPFTLDIGGVEILNADGRLGDDSFVINDLSGVEDLLAVNLLGSQGDDAFAFAAQTTLPGGRIDGGEGVDTISYDGYTAPVTVELDTGRQFFDADLSGANEVPPVSTPASGTGTFVLNEAGTELTFTITFEDLQGSLLGGPGAHFHGPATAEENAPIIRGLTPAELGDLTSSSGTFSGVWTSTDDQPLTPEVVEQLRDGLIYFNIHTTEFPAGEIRDQVLLTATETTTAPGLDRLVGVENVVGTDQADLLMGGALGNTLDGGGGDDTILGGGGDDNIVWNNGDGSDLIEGDDGTDAVIVNGADAGDAFEVNAGMTGRLDVRRTNLGTFNLDIGTVEAVDVNAGLGEDSITVSDLTDVDDLVLVDVDGGAENDVVDASNLPALSLVTNLRGGSGNDELLGSLGDDFIFGGQGDDTIIGGPGNDEIKAGPLADEALFAVVADDNTFLFVTADDPGQPRAVPALGLEPDEDIIGIDYRPAETDDVFYVVTDQARIYTATPDGQLTLRSTIDQPLDGTEFGVDFNPVADRLRIVSDTGQNLRVDVDTGEAIVDDELAFADDDLNALADPGVVAAAYTNGFAGASSTTLYTIDSLLDALLTQLPPNDGVLNTVGGLGVDPGDLLGFDILAGEPNVAFATLAVGGETGLYRIDLPTGAATPVGPIADGLLALRGLAAAPDNDTIIWDNGDGSDVVDGGIGRDTQQVNGASAGDTFAVSAGPDGRLLFRRTNLGPFTIDMGTVEVLEVDARSGDDAIVVDDLTGVEALQTIVSRGGEGDDLIDASALAVPIPLIATGGEGNDTIIGGPGDDILDGGPGNNRIIGGGGDNTIQAGRIIPADFDGDGISDFATYTNTPDDGLGLFEVRLSTTGETISRRLGGDGAFPVVGDYDGDGLSDFAVYEFIDAVGSGRFSILETLSDEVLTVPFGGPNDFPVAGDYDGDGRTDIAVFGFSPAEGFSRFAVIPSSIGMGFSRGFGGPNDFPVAGDYDGDGRTDIAVFGFSEADGFSRFGIVPSNLNDLTFSEMVGGFPLAFGGLDDVPMGGDYDGDGQTDFAVYGFSPADDASRFAILPEVGGMARAVPFGSADDLPVGADYDGDGITDLAVFGPADDDAPEPSRFLVDPSDGGDPITLPFAGAAAIALPPSSGLFDIQPLPPDAGNGDDDGVGTASRRAGRGDALIDLAIEGLMEDDDPEIDLS